MSAATRLLRDLAEEGIELGRGAVRWLENRFAVEETPENVARARRALSRVEPNVPARPRAADYVVRAQPQAAPPPRPQRRTQERSLAARPERPLAARPQPAAEQPLALPPPAEPLPSFAAKPRGGQWMSSSIQTPFSAFSPERVARQLTPISRTPELEDWWNRALTRYLQTDFGTPTDPLRELASAAGLADSPEQWSGFARDAVLNVPAGKMAVPVPPVEGAHPLTSTAFAEERAAMPWLSRLPATEPIYLLRPDELPQGALREIGYEMENALRVGQDAGAVADTIVPLDFAVRPESLNRMTFPQAVERVARIREWRAAQQAAREAERAALAQSNPALRTYREYAENNPQGFRWVEIAAPEVPMPEGALIRPVEGWDDMIEIVDPRTGMQLSVGATEQEARRLLAREEREQQLQDALSYEGDTMGHCVGNYCEDVLSGRTRIFSLRDAQGQPFVTVETRPGRRERVYDLVPQLQQRLGRDHPDYEEALMRPTDYAQANFPDLYEQYAAPAPDDIIQIKGSGKRQGQQQLRLSSRGYEGGPDDYLLPFVQDFVRQGQWGNVGDLANTGLVRLPDGRYITQAQLNEATTAAQQRFPRVDAQTILADGRDHPEAWAADYGPYFEGYAIGGRVDPERCFTRHPLSVRR